MAAASEKKPKIFLSYRREDSRWPSGQIAQRLSSHFGKDQVIYDLDALAPGLDFHKQIEREVKTCDYLIAVIGRLWLTACDETGRRRLDDPEDWVRREIELALKLDIPVIPLLLDDSSMPSSDQLPEGLKDLPRRHAQSIHPHPHFDLDLQRLIEKIEQINQKRLEDEIQAEIDRKAKEAEHARAKLEARIEDLEQQETRLRGSLKELHDNRTRLRDEFKNEDARLRELLKRLHEEQQHSEDELNQEEQRLREEVKKTQDELGRLKQQLGNGASAEPDIASNAEATEPSQDAPKPPLPAKPSGSSAKSADTAPTQRVAQPPTTEKKLIEPSSQGISKESAHVESVVPPQLRVIWPRSGSYLVAGSVENVRWKAKAGSGATLQRFELELYTEDTSQEAANAMLPSAKCISELPIHGDCRKYSWRISKKVEVARLRNIKNGIWRGIWDWVPRYRIKVRAWDNLGQLGEAVSGPFAVAARRKAVWIARTVGVLFGLALVLWAASDSSRLPFELCWIIPVFGWSFGLLVAYPPGRIVAATVWCAGTLLGFFVLWIVSVKSEPAASHPSSLAEACQTVLVFCTSVFVSGLIMATLVAFTSTLFKKWFVIAVPVVRESWGWARGIWASVRTRGSSFNEKR